MRTPVCWTEKLPGGKTRYIEVMFSGRDQIKWKIEVVSKKETIKSSSPSEEDWRYLLSVAEKWYARRRIPHKYVEYLRELAEKDFIDT